MRITLSHDFVAAALYPAEDVSQLLINAYKERARVFQARSNARCVHHVKFCRRDQLHKFSQNVKAAAACCAKLVDMRVPRQSIVEVHSLQAALEMSQIRS